MLIAGKKQVSRTIISGVTTKLHDSAFLLFRALFPVVISSNNGTTNENFKKAEAISDLKLSNDGTFGAAFFYAKKPTHLLKS